MKSAANERLGKRQKKKEEEAVGLEEDSISEGQYPSSESESSFEGSESEERKSIHKIELDFNMVEFVLRDIIA